MSESIEAKHGEPINVDDAWAAVQSGLNYVSWLAREFLYSGVARDDLEAEGRLGLFEAALRFDPQNGAQFLTYGSWWARRRMQTFVERHSRVVRRPASRVGIVRDRDEVSLDEPIGAGSPLRWADVLVDRGVPLAVDALMCAEDAAIVASAAAKLPPQWRSIIVRRFGLDGGPALTLAAVGDLHGLSRERVRQIEAKAMRRLRARLEEAWGRDRTGDRPPHELTTAAAQPRPTFTVVRPISGHRSTHKELIAPPAK